MAIEKKKSVSPALPSVLPSFSPMEGAAVFNNFDSPGQIDFQVSGYHQGMVQLSVVLPEELLKGFVHFFEGSYELFKSSVRKSQFLKAQEKSSDLSEIAKREDRLSSLNETICTVFDSFLKSGNSARESIRLTNESLKASGHVNLTYQIVFDNLRASGKLKKIGLYNNEKSAKVRQRK